ncbi:uncharacterized protein LOC119395632 isoform X2 [Rhipicephalus sanguineus]|uniref:uncharacterized protein LOC119395632 isoform X2 n=1 Tax=Rhipicephalus sanguineus TaxID=34632 RepID=UPI0018949485|nr:uncharacterized protein LOC119395632 isoform X2 [Rhipicephalus sanguineus]
MATDMEATGTERAAFLKVKIPVSSIYNFIDKQYDTSRLLQEGESVFEARHVVACSVKHRKEEEVTLAGLILQTSSINKEPHELEITVKERQVTAASCSCKAGQHKCKHMIALLLHIHATETFDVLSSTDMPQQWGKEQLTDARKKYKPRLIAELPCSKKETMLVHQDHLI